MTLALVLTYFRQVMSCANQELSHALDLPLVTYCWQILLYCDVIDLTTNNDDHVY